MATSMSYAIILLTSYESLKQSKRIKMLSCVMASFIRNISKSVTAPVIIVRTIEIVVVLESNLNEAHLGLSNSLIISQVLTKIIIS